MMSYRTGEAARILKISQHHARRLCETGLVKAQRTDGNRWRIPAAEVERLQKEGVPPAPQDDAGGTVRTPGPGGLSTVNAEAGPVREAIDDLSIMRARVKKRQAEKEFEETEDWFRSRQMVKNDELERERERKRQARAEGARAQWLTELKAGISSVIPEDVPISDRVELDLLIETALRNCGPETPQANVIPLLGAALKEGLRPYFHQQSGEEAVEKAVRWFQGQCPGWTWDELNKAKALQAKKISRQLVESLPVGTAEEEMVETMKEHLRPLLEETNREHLNEQVLESVRRLPELTQRERAEALETVRIALKRLPVGISDREFLKAKDAILKPVLATVNKRAQAKQRERQKMLATFTKTNRLLFQAATGHIVEEEDEDEDEDEEEDDE